MKKKSERQKLIDKADAEMSRFIRLFHADTFGVCTCVTCGYRGFWKGDSFHMGHFLPKGKGASSVRYIPHNCHPQCAGCNSSGGPMRTGHKQHVAPIIYTEYMQANYGQEIIDDLLQRKSQPIRYSDDDLIEIRQLYKLFADELERNYDA